LRIFDGGDGGGDIGGVGLSDKSTAAIRDVSAAAILAVLVISYRLSVFSKMREDSQIDFVNQWR